MMRGGVVLLVAVAALWPCILLAQPAERPSEEIRVGDTWVYDHKEGNSGLTLSTYSSVVAEISPKEIVTNVIYRGRNGSALVVFDHDWNRLVNGPFKHNPNDGHGIQWPLAEGKEWRHEFTTSNTQTGVNTKSSSLTKVVGKETVTTPAGTFETFKIERQIKEFVIADPSRYWDTQMLMWFAPQINHWVRRQFITKQEKRTTSNNIDELIDIIRKP
jgi:hypothetical protein